ncbi:MAG: eukaryotic-like serine/threonine-protein kinase [Thermoplasmata archaeon]|nr:eukaryotic-like serine/threonine-protein kinase [Thermoplasmata archaeon]
MLIPEATLATAVFAVLLGALVLAARFQALNIAAAGFLISRGAADFAYQMARQAPDVAYATNWTGIAQWLELPAASFCVMVAYVLLVPRPALHRSLALGAVLLVAFGVSAWALAQYPAGVVARAALGGAQMFVPAGSPVGRTYRVLTWLVEAAALLAAARAAVAPRRDSRQRRQMALVGLAFAVPLVNVTLLWLFGIPRDVIRGAFSVQALIGNNDGPGWLLFVAVGAGLGILAVAMSVRSLAEAFEGRQRRAAYALVAAAVALAAFDDAYYFTLYAHGLPMPRGYVNARFLVVGVSAACLALAFVQHDLAGFDERMRLRLRIAARIALMITLVGLPVTLVLAFAGLASWVFVLVLVLALASLTLAAAPLGALRAATSRLVLASHESPARADPAPLGPGRFRVERELARGTFGTVLLAQDVTTGRRVALKRPHAGGEGHFDEEARALRKVQSPRVVPLVEVVQSDAESLLVLDYMPGGDLATLLRTEGPLPVARAVALTEDLLEGLAAIHAAGLAHGDVKPSNVLLDAQGRAVLADLGAARRIETADRTLTASLGVGTYLTLAPERLRGGRADVAGDVYALGAVLYRMLTGEDYISFEGLTALQASDAILHETPRLPHARVPDALACFLITALQKEAGARYGDALGMRSALEKAKSELTSD